MSGILRSVNSYKDFTSEELIRYAEGKTVYEDTNQEVEEVFCQLNQFARAVADGGAWKAERVHIMMRRANVLESTHFIPDWMMVVPG